MKKTGAKKILITEDEKPMARALELKLIHEGYETKAAPNGQEGLNMLEKEDFDLVLLDLVMPLVDGFSVLKTLKTRGKMPFVIVLSNLSQEDDRKRALELGAKDFFVTSNTSLAEIVEKVKELIS